MADPSSQQGEPSIMSSIMNFFSSPTKQPSVAQQSAAQRAQYYEQNWKRPSGGTPAQAQRSPANVIGNDEAIRALDLKSDNYSSQSTSQTDVLHSSSNSNLKPNRDVSNLSSSSDAIGSRSGSGSSLERLDSRTIEDPKVKKFRKILERDNGPDLESLKQLSWSGIPNPFRPLVWRLLLGYAPLIPDRRESGLERKRNEYREMVLRHYTAIDSVEISPEWLASATQQEKGVLHQIRIDVPRTLPHNKMYRSDQAQGALERILFVWALRHPASSYVQGINDLVTPFFTVFIKEQLQLAQQRRDGVPVDLCAAVQLVDLNMDAPRRSPTSSSGEIPNEQLKLDIAAAGLTEEEALPLYNKRRAEDTDVDIASLDQESLFIAEADAFWCVTKFIDGIQDHYTPSQPGIQRMIIKLKELVHRLDSPLFDHLDSQEAQFIQFSFRWMNCLLMREFPLAVIIRLWDTYLAEQQQFPVLHTYVCAAMLLKFSHEIQARDFQGLMIFLQNLPTQGWVPDAIEPILSQAFMWMSLYNDAPSHLK